MNADVENEAKLHITNGIEKASSSTGVDIKVSPLNWVEIDDSNHAPFSSYSKLADQSKSRWTDNTDTHSTVSWERDLVSR